MSIDLSRPSSCAGEDCDSLLGHHSEATLCPNDGLARYELQRTSLLSSCVGNDEHEAQAHMDLALNANFDLGLFDYNWSDDPNNISASTATPMNTNNDNRSYEACDAVKISSNKDLLSSSFHGVTGGSSTLHPQAIPSSAECPPIVSTGASIDSGNYQSSQVTRNQQQNQGEAASFYEPPRAMSVGTQQTSDWTTNSSIGPLPSKTAVPNVTKNPMTSGPFFLPNQLRDNVPMQSLTPLPCNTANTGTTYAEPPPPFLLFDAPIELRANFIASQRAHGFPVLDDNNSFHYHQRQQQMQQAVDPKVRLIDGRHGGNGSKRVKNEREQKRTQKITDLIDQLRDRMEEGGWKVGGSKSKYATLST
jgi:hypothetical protein